jgi:hypothetical protein
MPQGCLPLQNAIFRISLLLLGRKFGV